MIIDNYFIKNESILLLLCIGLVFCFELCNTESPKPITERNKMTHITESDFTKVNNNANGNPRYVLHFLWIPTSVNNDIATMYTVSAYNEALGKTKSLGGKKFHNKQYGGGIAFSTYNLADLITKLNNLK